MTCRNFNVGYCYRWLTDDILSNEVLLGPAREDVHLTLPVFTRQAARLWEQPHCDNHHGGQYWDHHTAFHPEVMGRPRHQGHQDRNDDFQIRRHFLMLTDRVRCRFDRRLRRASQAFLQMLGAIAVEEMA